MLRKQIFKKAYYAALGVDNFLSSSIAAFWAAK
jgi:hypothetical protein